MTRAYRPASKPYKVTVPGGVQQKRKRDEKGKPIGPKPVPLSRPVRAGDVLSVHPLEWQLVDGKRTRPERCRVVVDVVGETRLDRLTVVDALSAGFEGLEPLYEFWRSTWRTGPLEMPLVHVVEFSLDTREGDLLMAWGHGHTTSPGRSLDPEAPLVQDVRYLDQWASKAEETRLAKVAAAKARWRHQRRYGKDAA